MTREEILEFAGKPVEIVSRNGCRYRGYIAGIYPTDTLLIVDELIDDVIGEVGAPIKHLLNCDQVVSIRAADNAKTTIDEAYELAKTEVGRSDFRLLIAKGRQEKQDKKKRGSYLIVNKI